MSSYYTTITIKDQEWAEIQRKVCESNTYVARKKEEVERLKEEIRKREEELKKIKESANKMVGDAILDLQSNFQRTYENLENQYDEALRDSAKSFNAEMFELRKEVEDTSKKTLEASAHISEISKCYSELISSILKQNNDNAERANAFLDSITPIHEQIRELNPLVFDPITYSEVENVIVSIKGNINAGRYQAAMMNAQFDITKASELLAKLILINDSYYKHLAETLEFGNLLKEKFDQFDSSMDGGFEFEIDGDKYEYDFDIDHWSEGRFSSLRDEFELLYRQLKKAKSNPIPTEKLTLMKERLMDLDSCLIQCRDVAKREMIGSLKAQETAARLCDSLTENGWELGKHGFEEDDDRNPYTTIYRDASGNSVSIVVSPGTNVEKPDIFIEAFSDDESRANIVKDNIQTILPNEGLCIEQTQKLNDCQQNNDEKAFINNTLTRAKQLNSQRRNKSFGV